jgi:hypothetical protein
MALVLERNSTNNLTNLGKKRYENIYIVNGLIKLLSLKLIQ